MKDKSLSLELDYALWMEERLRTELMYWRLRRRELEQKIESESMAIMNEFDEVAMGAWDDDS